MFDFGFKESGSVSDFLDICVSNSVIKGQCHRFCILIQQLTQTLFRYSFLCTSRISKFRFHFASQNKSVNIESQPLKSPSILKTGWFPKSMKWFRSRVQLPAVPPGPLDVARRSLHLPAQRPAVDRQRRPYRQLLREPLQK